MSSSCLYGDNQIDLVPAAIISDKTPAGTRSYTCIHKHLPLSQFNERLSWCRQHLKITDYTHTISDAIYFSSIGPRETYMQFANQEAYTLYALRWC